jgi:hypothetical protein
VSFPQLPGFEWPTLPTVAAHHIHNAAQQMNHHLSSSHHEVMFTRFFEKRVLRTHFERVKQHI